MSMRVLVVEVRKGLFPEASTNSESLNELCVSFDNTRYSDQERKVIMPVKQNVFKVLHILLTLLLSL